MNTFKTLILFLFLSIQCQAGTIDPNKSDSEYIKYGEKHQCVTQISGIDKKSERKYYASCVIIRPRIIITAAHILTESVDETSFIIFNKQEIKILAYVYPKEFSKEKFGFKDIAVAYLEKDINIDFYPDLYENEDEVGKICSIAGYGITGNYVNGANISDSKKRAGSNIIDQIINELLICSLDGGSKTQLEFLIANGDSGGGLFIDKKLAGINSCVIADDGSPNSSFKDWSGHTRISIHKDWIKEVVDLFEKVSD